jgi:ABC-type branched-subunit amino acid transport system substrate-binding protein
MIRTAIVFVLIVVSAGLSPIHAQEDVSYQAQAESLFMLGMRLYVQQDYKSAMQTLKQTAELQPLHHRTTAAIVMEAKSANALGLYADATSLCMDFLSRFPFSLYVEDAQYTLGIAYGGMKQYRAAAVEMAVVLASAQVRATRWRAREDLDMLAPYLTAAELRTLEAGAVDDSARVFLSLLRGESYKKSGVADSAAAIGRAVTTATVDKNILRRARRLLPNAVVQSGDTLTVGVLLPFMNHLNVDSRERQTSEAILRGFREALREYLEDMGPDQPAIRFIVHDTQRQREPIERYMTQWRNDSTVVAVLGPLFSDETMIAAAKANDAGIPLSSPTATGNNIASIGPGIFQANPDYAMRGALMAQYAVRIAGLENLAVLTTSEPPGSLVADAFALEANRLGANLISFQRYSSGVSDYRQLLLAMKSDAATAKVGPIQAIYCPITSSADIGAVSSQLQAFDGTITVLGTDEWFDDEELDRNKMSADGVIFCSDRWDNGDAETFSGVSFESFGYDTASLLFRCITSAHEARASIQKKLSSVREYDGIHSKISFTTRRVNSFMHILQYKSGFIKKITDIDYRR